MSSKENNLIKYSTTRLAKDLNISTKQLFERLTDAGLIVRENDDWCLTKTGSQKGGEYIANEKFGRYIVWPVQLIELLNQEEASQDEKLITSTIIGKEFDLSPNRLNSILSEIGWINKDKIKGWHITELGKRLGGVEYRHSTSGISFVRWPEHIMENDILVSNVNQAKGDVSQMKKNLQRMILIR